ncbi:hypothetical protein [Candidatus Uabimicrobium amorphum]|uniref:Beta-barrel assembly-enhancing protease n=1 Tax=Uabimicrobium amorphum TaxID=2596890 RepID=A0A5S9F355_UABAM|nr:hypothetical protein [Candidatus Uabimicrobium amorphum]BBM83911.1 beta-barrel assembly-enhancing protease [Candidatus Uabimicrobium amorphum]
MYKLLIFAALCIIGCSSVSKKAQANYDQAINEWNDGNYNDPIILLEEAVADSPKFLDAHLKLAEYKVYRSQTHGALESIDKALALDNSIPQPFILRGKALVQLEENLKAQGEYNKALKLEPSTEQKFEIYLGKAIAKINLGLHEDAQTYIDKAKKVSPDSRRIIYLNALLREKKMGPNSLTIKEYKQVLGQDPTDTDVLKSIGDTWRQLDVPNKAIKHYKEYLAAGGKSPEVKQYLDEQIQIRKQQQLVEQQKITAEQAQIELERIKAEVEKAKAQAKLEAQKALADAEARKAIADAEAEKAKAEAEKAKAEAENAKYLNDPLLKNTGTSTKILTCPVCGRIYKDGKQKTCDYDGTPLIDLTEE